MRTGWSTDSPAYQATVTLNQALRGQRPEFRLPVTRARCRAAFATGRRHPRQRAHLVESAIAVWINGQPHFGALYRCGDSSTTPRPVDIDDPAIEPCDRCLLHQGDWLVYAFYSEGERPLYIGQTSDLLGRIRGHARERAPWWPAVLRYEVLSRHGSQREVLDAERAAILRLDPVFNIRPPRVAASA